MKKEPLRMCIACKNMMPKAEMLKIVKNRNGEIKIDENFKKEGRGAYICKNVNCVNLLVKKKLLNRAFKCNIDESFYFEIKGIVDAE